MAAHVKAVTEEVRRLVAATYTVIEQTGSTDVSLRAILSAAGCSNQAFYRHFSSKDDLLLALLSAGQRRLADEMRERMGRSDSPAERVAAWVRCVLEQAVDERTALRTRPFIAGLGRLEARFPDELRQSRDLLVSVLAETLPDSAERHGDAYATYDLAFGAMQRHLLARTTPSENEIDILIRYAQRALGTTSVAPEPAAS